MSNGQSVVRASEYTRVISRWWWVIALSLLGGLVLGVLGARSRPEVFTSDSRVEVRPLVSSGDSPNLDIGRQVNTETEQAIASSQRVVERGLALLQAAETLGITDLNDSRVVEAASEIEIGGEEARAVQEQMEITVPAGSEILRFTAEAGKAVRAQQLAQAMAHGYLDFREDAALRSTGVARDQLDARELELLSELQDLAANIGAAGDNEAARQGLLYEEVSKRQELSGIGASLANIDAISINVGEVLDDAELPISTSGLPAAVGPAAGLVLGAAVGLVLAFVLDGSDDRIRDPESELTQLGLDIFGYAPAADTTVKATSATGHVDEAYRRVQASLLYKLDNEDKNVILVSGTNNPQSSTNVAAHLAVAAARAGRRTLLIGADLRQPHIHEHFGMTNEKGLSDVLAARLSLNEAKTNVPGLTHLEVVTAGPQVSQPTVLLQGPNLAQLIPLTRKEYDLVIFEAPPVMQVADAVVLGRLCEAAVLVVEPGRSSRSDVSESVDQLRGVGADVIGTVVTDKLKS